LLLGKVSCSCQSCIAKNKKSTIGETITYTYSETSFLTSFGENIEHRFPTETFSLLVCRETF
ncbi:hypothetical protein SKAU_G00061280, partial [Synaphobranchus kaupii]